MYSAHPDEIMCAGIRAYMDKLLKWNETISLTAVRDPDKILRFHFGESLFAEHLLPRGVCRLADVGSGAGFPGLPLRMANPEMELTLIESNSKKCVFLQQVARDLQLSNVHVFRGRMEDYMGPPNSFDVITTRAVGGRAEIVEWSKMFLSANGRLLLWLVDDDAEDVMENKGWDWRSIVRIPQTKDRCILVGLPRQM